MKRTVVTVVILFTSSLLWAQTRVQSECQVPTQAEFQEFFVPGPSGYPNHFPGEMRPAMNGREAVIWTYGVAQGRARTICGSSSELVKWLGTEMALYLKSAGSEQLGPAKHKLNRGTEPGFLAPDPNKVYSPGQKIKIEAPHGAYDGLLEMDRVYFIRVDRAQIKTTHPDAAEDCKINPNECADGSVEAHVRHATSPSWKAMNFAYKCELRELRPEQIEVARPGLKEGNLLIGSHDSVCELTGSLPLP